MLLASPRNMGLVSPMSATEASDAEVKAGEDVSALLELEPLMPLNTEKAG